MRGQLDQLLAALGPTKALVLAPGESLAGAVIDWVRDDQERATFMLDARHGNARALWPVEASA